MADVADDDDDAHSIKQQLSNESQWSADSTYDANNPPPPKIPKSPGTEVSLQEAVMLLREMCGDLFIPPKRISKIDRVGAGAFATVDICELRSADGRHVREVAVKRLRPECFTDKDTVKDFVMEVMVMARLHHTYVGWDVGHTTLGDFCLFVCAHVEVVLLR